MKDLYSVFGVHDDDRASGEKFLENLRSKFPKGQEYYFYPYTTFSVKTEKEYSEALAEGRKYFVQTVGTADEIKYTVEANSYGERRCFGSVSLFAIQTIPLFQGENGSLNGADMMIAKMRLGKVSELPFGMDKIISKIATKFGLDINNIYTRYSYQDNTVEVIYGDYKNQLNYKQLKSNITKDIFKNITTDKNLKAVILTSASGKYLTTVNGIVAKDEILNQ